LFPTICQDENESQIVYTYLSFYFFTYIITQYNFNKSINMIP